MEATVESTVLDNFTKARLLEDVIPRRDLFALFVPSAACFG